MPAAPHSYCARCSGICNGTCKRAASRQYDKDRRRSDPFHALYKTARWIALAFYVTRTRDILCKHCGHKAAKECDHIVPARIWVARGGDFWDESNLQGLCKSCHSIKSGKERRQ